MEPRNLQVEIKKNRRQGGGEKKRGEEKGTEKHGKEEITSGVVWKRRRYRSGRRAEALRGGVGKGAA